MLNRFNILQKHIFIILSLLLINTISCQENIRDSFKEYYFNLEDFKTPIVYKYENPKDSTATQYWEFSSDVKSNELVTKTFDYNFNQIEFFKEKFTKKGAELLVYQPIENEKTTNTVPKDLDVFKWSSSEAYKYSVSYEDKKYGKTIFEKERVYIGEEKITIMGKTDRAIKFKGTYRFNFISQKKSYEYYQYSYYLKDFGFVKYERYFPDGYRTELILTKIFKESKN